MEPQTTVPKENFLKEIVKFTLLAVAIVVPIRMYVAQPFIVSGASMNPTFADRQYLIVDQLTYHFQDVKREDVIILKYPLNPKTFFIKRVIGLPNETIVSRAGKITITNKDNPDGFIFDDKHVSPERKGHDDFNITLGDKEYFVMGDNRRESSDSRVWGALEEKYIVGKPFIRLFPLSKIAVSPGK